VSLRPVDDSGEEEGDDEGEEEGERRKELGVEIEVTPAGKSTRRLSLLSGGEKSLEAARDVPVTSAASRLPVTAVAGAPPSSVRARFERPRRLSMDSGER